MSFLDLQFSQKNEQKIRRYYYGTSSRIVFVCFLWELKTPKRHFEINWALKANIPNCYFLCKRIFKRVLFVLSESILVKLHTLVFTDCLIFKKNNTMWNTQYIDFEESSNLSSIHHCVTTTFSNFSCMFLNPNNCLQFEF